MLRPSVLAVFIACCLILGVPAFFHNLNLYGNPSVSFSSDNFLYQGRPFFIKGVAYGISYPGKKKVEEIPFSVFEQDFRKIKEAGFNTIRVYNPLPAKLLDLADETGLMVIEGLAPIDDKTNFESKEELEKIKKEVLRIIRRDKNRKCVLMWSLWNDAPFHWGKNGGNVVRRYGFKKVNDFLRQIYESAKKEDGKRPFTASNVLNAPGYQVGLDFIDVIGMNVYVGIYDWSTGAFDPGVGNEMVERLKRLSKDYHKPLYISETGQSGFSVLNTQKEVIPGQIMIIDENLSGFVIFEWQDEWQKAGRFDRQENHIETHWGLVDAFRKPKDGFAEVAKLLNEIPTESYGYEGNRSFSGKQEAESPDPKDLFLVEDFEYQNNKELLDEYKSRWSSRCRVSTVIDDKDFHYGKSSLKIVIKPGDTGAWFETHKYFEKPMDFSDKETLNFWIKSEGPRQNLCLMLIDNDNERYRTPPVLLEGGANWRKCSFALDKLFRDFYDKDYDGAGEGGDNRIDLKHIKGIAVKINDVPNLETLDVSSIIHVDDVSLINSVKP